MNDEDRHGDEVCDADLTNDSVEFTETAVVYWDTGYWLAVFEARSVEQLVVSVDVREQEVEVAVDKGVLSDAGTVRFGGILVVM